MKGDNQDTKLSAVSPDLEGISLLLLLNTVLDRTTPLGPPGHSYECPEGLPLFTFWPCLPEVTSSACGAVQQTTARTALQHPNSLQVCTHRTHTTLHLNNADYVLRVDTHRKVLQPMYCRPVHMLSKHDKTFEVSVNDSCICWPKAWFYWPETIVFVSQRMLHLPFFDSSSFACLFFTLSIFNKIF